MVKLLFFIFIVNLSSFAQVNFLKEYYQDIDKAEMAITLENYQEGFNEYKTAFSKVKMPFASDIYNAITCKILLNDFVGAKPLFMKLAKMGVSGEIIENSLLKDLAYFKKEWDEFKFVYNQVVVVKNEHSFYPILDSLENEYNIINGNKLIFKFDENEQPRFYKLNPDKIDIDESKSYSKSQVDSISVIANLIALNFFNKTQKFLIDYVIRNGFVSEFEMPIEDSNFLRNKLGTAFDVYGKQMTFGEMGTYSVSTLLFDLVDSTQKRLFNLKINEQVKNGSIHRDLGQKLLFLSSERKDFYFTKIKIENLENCPDSIKKNAYVITYKSEDLPNLLLDKNPEFDFYSGKTDLLFQKAKYKNFDNNYFLIASKSKMEETTVPNCEIAQKIMEGAKILDNN